LRGAFLELDPCGNRGRVARHRNIAIPALKR
jgi:hypothetical protein